MIDEFGIKFGFCYGDHVSNNDDKVEIVRSNLEIQNIISKILSTNENLRIYPKHVPVKGIMENKELEIDNYQNLKSIWNNKINIIQTISIKDIPEGIESIIKNTLEKLTDILVITSLDSPNKTSNDKKIKLKINYWQIAPAEGARLWDELRDQGIAAVGYSGLNFNLKNKSKDELLNLFNKSYPEYSVRSAKINITQLWNFLNLKPGDKIVTNKGKSLLLGLGEVKDGYKYRPDRKEYKHTVDVDYYKISEEGKPIPDNLKGKFGKTIIPLKKNEFETLEALFADDSKQKREGIKINGEKYAKSDALKDLFIEEEYFDYTIERLKAKKISFCKVLRE